MAPLLTLASLLLSSVIAAGRVTPHTPASTLAGVRTHLAQLPRGADAVLTNLQAGLAAQSVPAAALASAVRSEAGLSELERHFREDKSIPAAEIDAVMERAREVHVDLREGGKLGELSRSVQDLKQRVSDNPAFAGVMFGERQRGELAALPGGSVLADAGGPSLLRSPLARFRRREGDPFKRFGSVPSEREPSTRAEWEAKYARDDEATRRQFDADSKAGDRRVNAIKDLLRQDPGDFKPEELTKALSEFRTFGWEAKRPAHVFEGYLIGGHSDTVQQNSESSILAEGLLPAPATRSFWRLLLALHDIGKDRSFTLTGSRAKQHQYTEEIILLMMHRFGIEPELIRLGLGILHSESLGRVLRRRPLYDKWTSERYIGSDAYKAAAEEIRELVKSLGMRGQEKVVFELLKAFYLSDAGSYPGLRLIFTSKDGKLSYSPRSQARLARLWRAVLNPEDADGPITKKARAAGVFVEYHDAVFGLEKARADLGAAKDGGAPRATVEDMEGRVAEAEQTLAALEKQKAARPKPDPAAEADYLRQRKEALPKAEADPGEDFDTPPADAAAAPKARAAAQAPASGELKEPETLAEIVSIFGVPGALDENLPAADPRAVLIAKYARRWGVSESTVRARLQAAVERKAFLDDAVAETRDLLTQIDGLHPERPGETAYGLARVHHDAWYPLERAEGAVRYTKAMSWLLWAAVGRDGSGVLKEDAAGERTVKLPRSELFHPKKKFKIYPADLALTGWRRALFDAAFFLLTGGSRFSGRTYINTLAAPWDSLPKLGLSMQYGYELQAHPIGAEVAALVGGRAMKIASAQSTSERIDEAIDALAVVNERFQAFSRLGGFERWLTPKPYDVAEKGGVGLGDIRKDLSSMRVLLEWTAANLHLVPEKVKTGILGRPGTDAELKKVLDSLISVYTLLQEPGVLEKELARRRAEPAEATAEQLSRFQGSKPLLEVDMARELADAGITKEDEANFARARIQVMSLYDYLPQAASQRFHNAYTLGASDDTGIYKALTALGKMQFWRVSYQRMYADLNAVRTENYLGRITSDPQRKPIVFFIPPHVKRPSPYTAQELQWFRDNLAKLNPKQPVIFVLGAYSAVDAPTLTAAEKDPVARQSLLQGILREPQAYRRTLSAARLTQKLFKGRQDTER